MKTRIQITDHTKTAVLWTEAESRETALHDLIKYIDKMAMLGSKFSQLDAEIQSALWTRRHDRHLEDFEHYCQTELAALTYMASKLTGRALHNKLICHALEKGDSEVAAYRKDFERKALKVKEYEVAAREDFLKLGKFRHRSSLLVG